MVDKIRTYPSPFPSLAVSPFCRVCFLFRKSFLSRLSPLFLFLLECFKRFHHRPHLWVYFRLPLLEKFFQCLHHRHPQPQTVIQIPPFLQLLKISVGCEPKFSGPKTPLQSYCASEVPVSPRAPWFVLTPSRKEFPLKISDPLLRTPFPRKSLNQPAATPTKRSHCIFSLKPWFPITKNTNLSFFFLSLREPPSTQKLPPPFPKFQNSLVESFPPIPQT